MSVSSYPVTAPALPHPTERPAGVALIAPGLRVLTAFAALVGATVVTVLGIHVANRRLITSLDARIWLHAITHWHSYRTAARYVSSIGGMTGITLMSVAIAAVMLVRRQRRGAVLALGAPLIATSLTEFVLKPVVNNAPWGINTYPSGHSTGGFAVAFVVTILVLGPHTPVRNVAARWVIALVSIMVAAAVAIGLVVAGYHFLTDTIGGAAVALCVVPALALIIDTVANGYARRRSHV